MSVVTSENFHFFIFSIKHPEDIDLMFSLDAWREPNALCGLFKHFLRRLPVGLFSLCECGYLNVFSF